MSMPHVLVVTEDADFDPEEPYYEHSIECPGPDHCHGWIECQKDHDGFDPHDEDSPALDQYEDVEIHGVPHEWRYGNGWTVPFEGCIVDWSVCQWGCDSADDIAREHGVGRWLVYDEWDDDLVLCYVGPEESEQCSQ